MEITVNGKRFKLEIRYLSDGKFLVGYYGEKMTLSIETTDLQAGIMQVAEDIRDFINKL